MIDHWPWPGFGGSIFVFLVKQNVFFGFGFFKLLKLVCLFMAFIQNHFF